MHRIILIFTLLTFMVGCVTPRIKKNELNVNDRESAFVIVALKGNMSITEARKCDTVCTAWYTFGKEKKNGVHIFRKSVGSTFEMNLLYSYTRYVYFEGKTINIDSPGIYYFGLIQSIDNELCYVPEPNPAILREVIEKYGNDVTKLTPIGFTWPEN